MSGGVENSMKNRDYYKERMSVREKSPFKMSKSLATSRLSFSQNFAFFIINGFFLRRGEGGKGV